MQCPIDPEGTKVIVVPDEIDEKSAGGIWLAPEAKEAHQLAVTHGTLVAIGPRAEVTWNTDGDGKSERPGEPGDRVIFVKYAGTNVQWGDQVYQILQDQDIIGLMLEDPPAVDFTYKDKKKSMTDRIVIPQVAVPRTLR